MCNYISTGYNKSHLTIILNIQKQIFQVGIISRGNSQTLLVSERLFKLNIEIKTPSSSSPNILQQNINMNVQIAVHNIYSYINCSYLYIKTQVLASFVLKAAKYEIQKTSTCRATLFRCLFLVDVSRCFQRKIFPEKRPPCLFTLAWTFKFVLANQMRV